MKFDESGCTWIDGYGLNGASGELEARANRCAIDGFIACKAGSYVRVKDKAYQFAIWTYAGIEASSKLAYTGYFDDYWIADRDCFIRVSARRVAGPSLTGADAADAVALSLFGGGSVSFAAGGISADGSENDSANRMRSGYWYCKKGTTLQSKTGFNYYVRRYAGVEASSFLDFGGAHAPTYSAALTPSAVYTIPTSSYYRFSLAASGVYNLFAEDVFFIVEADERDAADAVTGAPLTAEPFLYDGAVTTELLTAPFEGTYGKLIGWYDDLLAAYPDNVTKTQIGTSQDGAYKIWAYAIESHDYNATRKPPLTPYRHETVLWVSNIHGSEHHALTETYWMAKELLEHHDSNEALAAIWFNCRLVVVPALNPYGVDLQGASGRGNARGVDLNRNFDANWTAGEADNGLTFGAEPFSEAETQALRHLVLDLYPDALFVINRHDAGYLSDAPHGVPYTSDVMIRDKIVLRDLTRRVNSAFRRKYGDWLAKFDQEARFKNMLRTWENSANMGTMDKWLNMIGVHACLLESPRDGGDAQSSLQLGYDTSVNLLLAILANADYIRSSGELEEVYHRSALY